MRVRNAPRYQGKITSWKDNQGFGFITPNGGGPAVFVHIKSFGSRAIRPVEGDIVTYHLTINEKAQPRAENVAFVRDPAAVQNSSHTGGGALALVASFFTLLAVSALAGKVPLPVFGLYLGLSVLSFIAYAIDKSAARHHRSRTPENTLHMLGLIGGWPGALVAQQTLRHKSKKASFRREFWCTVVFNCVALCWLLSRI